MIDHENIKTWDDFKELELDKQVELVNELMAKGYSIPRISESIGVYRTTIADHFKKNGYKRYADSFILANEKIVIKKEHKKESKEVKVEVKHTPKEKAPKQEKLKALEVYSDVHNILVNIDTDSYVRTSISLAKSTNTKLDSFLKGLKLLNKQDVITVALEEFIAKYSQE